MKIIKDNYSKYQHLGWVRKTRYRCLDWELGNVISEFLEDDRVIAFVIPYDEIRIGGQDKLVLTKYYINEVDIRLKVVPGGQRDIVKFEEIFS